VRICLVTMELDPFVPGGYGATVRALATALASRHEVTLVTTAPPDTTLATLAAAKDPRLVAGVRHIGVEQRDEHPGCVAPEQGVAARVLDAVVGAYSSAGPHVVISADFLGMAAFLINARRGGHAVLRETRFIVRTAGTAELCAIHNYGIDDTVRSGVVHALERQCLRDADLLWTQSAETIAAYRRHYGDEALAPHAVLPTPELAARVLPRAPRTPDEPLRFLYLGRLERRKGTLDLVDGFSRVADDGWTLTLAGGDTPTGPGGHWITAVIDAMGDSRVRVAGPVVRSEVPRLLSEHDVYVAASMWETWGHSPCEAIRAGLPALVTPTGGFPEMVGAGKFGWVCGATGAAGLADGLRRVLADRPRALALRGDPALTAHIDQLADPGPLIDAIEAIGHGRATTRRRRRRPLVTAIVPYYRASRWIGETLASLRCQTYPNLEILVVNDGSFASEDVAVYDSAAVHDATVISTPNRGQCAARNTGVRQAAGEYLVFLDADNIATPEWVERLVDVSLREPDVGYVSSWLRMVDEQGQPVPDGPWSRYCPLGNDHPVVDQCNIAGDQAALVPRERFVRDGIWFSESMFLRGDWEYYRALRQAGRRGCVIPEELVLFRLHAERVSAQYSRERHGSPHELAASLATRRTTWTVPSTNTSMI
jgi:glycosyltransferase involved in cell wall biosynthesis